MWWRCYREPHEDPRLSQQEREHIENGGGLSAPTDQQVAFSWPLVRQLLSKRQIIGASIGQFAGNTVLVFFSRFPRLATERHMPAEGRLFSILPFVAAAGGDVGGWLSDKLLKATGSANLGRSCRRCRPADGQLHHHRQLAGERPGGDPVMSFAFLAKGWWVSAGR